MNKIQIMEDLVYDENIGASGMLDLYIPKENVSETVLIYIHGGGLESGDKIDEKGIYEELASCGITVASVNYRTYPSAKYPEFIEDAAKAIAWCFEHIKEYVTYKHVFVGGISAGSYLSMMLHFQPEFLAKYGVKEAQIDGYIFDAGQPTAHYKILEERGMDPKSVRVDETAPIYYLAGECEKNTQAFLILVGDNDLVGRKEQNELLIRTMETHNYDKTKIDYRIMENSTHVEYVNKTDAQGKYPYAKMLYDFIENALK